MAVDVHPRLLPARGGGVVGVAVGDRVAFVQVAALEQHRRRAQRTQREDGFVGGRALVDRPPKQSFGPGRVGRPYGCNLQQTRASRYEEVTSERKAVRTCLNRRYY